MVYKLFKCFSSLNAVNMGGRQRQGGEGIFLFLYLPDI